MRRKGGGKEFIDNKSCRIAEVSDNRQNGKRGEKEDEGGRKLDEDGFG